MRSKELWLVQENHATVRPDLGVHPRGMKTYSERKIELQNLQILKKMLEKSSQFLSSEQLCERKSLDVALNIAGVEKIPFEILLYNYQLSFIYLVILTYLLFSKFFSEHSSKKQWW